MNCELVYTNCSPVTGISLQKNSSVYNLPYRRLKQRSWSRYLFILLKQISLVLTVMISMAYSLGFYRHTEQLKV